MSTPTNNIAFTGIVPKNYDTNMGPVYFEPYAIDMAERVTALNPSSVLETASGTGRVTVHLRNKLNSTAKIIATDINPDMLAVAKEKLAGSDVICQEEDALHLPFEDNNFDVVIAQFGIMFYPDKLKGMQEALRVLRKGGTFLFSVWDKLEYNFMTKTAREIITDFFENNPPAFYDIPFGFNNTDEISGLLREAGFSKINFEILKKDSVAQSAELIASGMVKGSPIAHAIRERNADAVEILNTKVAAALAEKFGHTPCKSTMQAIVFTAQK